jgi:dihydrofolate reductase
MIDGGISYDGDVLWEHPTIAYKFDSITCKCNERGKMNALIMGRKTWETIQEPIPGRINIIVTTDHRYEDLCHAYENVVVCSSIIAALAYCNSNSIINDIFVIGGAGIIDTFLQTKIYFNIIDKVYLTILFHNHEYVADTFVDINALFQRLTWAKDDVYKTYADKRLFASYICTPRIDTCFKMI